MNMWKSEQKTSHAFTGKKDPLFTFTSASKIKMWVLYYFVSFDISNLWYLPQSLLVTENVMI